MVTWRSIAVVYAAVLAGATPAAMAGIEFYTITGRDGDISKITWEPGEELQVTFVRDLGTTSYYYGAMDFGPDGRLYIHRGTGGSTFTNSGIYYLNDPATSLLTRFQWTTNPANSNLSGMQSALDAGLTFTGDGSLYAGTGLRYVSGIAGVPAGNKSALFWVDPGSPYTTTQTQTYYDPHNPNLMQSFNAPAIQGLQWYDGQLFALTSDSRSATYGNSLHLRVIEHGTTNLSPYDTFGNYDGDGDNGLEGATVLSKGDLALVDDAMFALVNGKLYYYDMLLGPGQMWTYMGTLPTPPNWSTPTGSGPDYYTGLAALPGQVFSRAVVPEPATLLIWLVLIVVAVVPMQRHFAGNRSSACAGESGFCTVSA
jgi:hypothetical protein